MKVDSTRVATIDGLRAIAVGLVVSMHFVDSGAVPRDTWFARLTLHGAFGVKIFFVISGFLITRWLLRAEASSRGIGLRTFYLSRAFRILPPVLVFLTFVFCLYQANLVASRPLDFVTSLFMIHNLFYYSDALAHFWSLSIEEQFYFIFPLFLLVVRGRKGRILVLSSILILAPIWFMFNIIHRIYPHPWRTDFNFGELSAGCLLALLYQSERAASWLKSRLLQRDLSLLVFTVVLVFTFLPPLVHLGNWLDPFRAVLVALILSFCVEPSDRWGDRLLGWRPLVWLGERSYGIYLWQQVFIRLPAEHWFQTFPANLSIVLIAASLSYRYVEKPALRMRTRFVGEGSRVGTATVVQ